MEKIIYNTIANCSVMKLNGVAVSPTFQYAQYFDSCSDYYDQ